MRTFEEQVEGLTQIAITASSNPTQDELSQFLRDGVKDLVSKLLRSGLPPSMMAAFAKSENVTNGNGLASDSSMTFSVLRGDGTILNPAREIPVSLKGRVEDTESLYYASKYNPVFYRESGRIYIKPDPTSSSNENGEVLHVVYDNGVTYSSVSISDFPASSEYLVVYYAGAMSCLAAAGNVESTLPTAPTDIGTPSFIYDQPDLPTVPVYDVPTLSITFDDVLDSLNEDDPEMADKFLEIISKQLEAFDKEQSTKVSALTADTKEFETEMQRRLTNADKQLGQELGEFTSKIRKYTGDIQNYTSEVNEKLIRYKWFLQQYAYLMAMYNAGITGVGKPPKAEQAQPAKVPKEERKEKE